MKSLIIQSQHYKYLLQSYKEWLQILGYAAQTATRWPIHVKEFVHFLEQHNIQHITSVESKHINDFVNFIKHRPNKSKKGTALSANHINQIINAINGFAKYLNSTGKYILDSTPKREYNNTGEKIILSIPEAKQLYESTFLPYRENSIAMGQRDRAIIAVYYGCGLRRSEGIRLNITDIDLQQKLLFVRKGKGNKQRYVPIANKHLQDIKDYLKEGREWFLYHHDSSEMHHSKRHGEPLLKKETTDDNAFFASQYGGRLTHIEQRLKLMKQRAGIEKNVTLHGLRHSIATHLLQSGMDIEEVAKFLGHASLESTQIYTHIVNEISEVKNDGTV
jgi:integrase/recombinase XerD